MTSISVVPSQAMARKRRKAILASHKSTKRQKVVPVESDEDERRDESSSNSVCTTTPSPTSTTKRTLRTLTCKGKVIKSNTKYQNRYEPEVPMTKEQEAEWRKEARRQRNRESAAASRSKVRNRIQELENEVEDWKVKVGTLMKRIDLLEGVLASTTAVTSTTMSNSQTEQCPRPSSSPKTPKTIYVPSSVSTCSEEHNYLSIPFIPDLATSSYDSSSPSSSSSPILLQEQKQSKNIQQNVANNNVDLHVIEITSRPAESM